MVKAFNHIQFAELASHGQPAGTADRRALVIAGDDAAAKATVTELLDSFGYDVVDAGSLAEGWRFEPDHPAYGPRLTRSRADRSAGRGATEGPLRTDVLTGAPRSVRSGPRRVALRLPTVPAPGRLLRGALP